jgi:hypothetical protein
VSDSTSLANLLVLFPGLQKELDVTLKDALGRVKKTGFQRSKERVIIAEAFFNKEPGIAENDRRELVALIKDAGDSKELKTRLKGWESSSTGGPSSIFSVLKSVFVSKEQTSKSVDDAARRSRDIKDSDFLAALPEKVSKEPLLEQLVQDVVAEAHGYFREFMTQRLPRLYSRVHDIRQQMVYRQVELGANEQDQGRKVSSRSIWFDEIKMAQAQANPGYVLCCPRVYPALLKCIL